jgi:VanZ family protein
VPAAPNPLHEKGLEDEWLSETRLGHAAKISTSASLVVSFSVRRFLKYWLPPILWIVFIFIGSTDLLSAAHTSRFIGPFLRWFAPDVSDETIGSIQLFVRKCGHLTEYAVLAALLLRSFRQRLAAGAPAMAFILTAILAALDEFHQSFVASRTGSPWDVLVDCCGALAGLTIYSWAIGNRESKIQNRS